MLSNTSRTFAISEVVSGWLSSKSRLRRTSISSFSFFLSRSSASISRSRSRNRFVSAFPLNLIRTSIKTRLYFAILYLSDSNALRVLIVAHNNNIECKKHTHTRSHVLQAHEKLQHVNKHQHQTIKVLNKEVRPECRVDLRQLGRVIRWLAPLGNLSCHFDPPLGGGRGLHHYDETARRWCI